ncbi:hypothetical protein [Rhodococcus baikonurensis]|jgi:hypothetical protein|uniref:Uncharacterized protein n=1 Tax=Rhodococcus baikonurensis TaxID=172041 RepID=A0ABV5XGC8_9NOCA
MFENERDYPCAVTNSSAGDPTAIGLAFHSVRQRKQPGQKILLWTSQKSNISNNRQVKAISRERDVVVGTSRGRNSSDWSEGPALGMWHDTEDMAKVPLGQPTAMCMVPWISDRLAAWYGLSMRKSSAMDATGKQTPSQGISTLLSFMHSRA